VIEALGDHLGVDAALSRWVSPFCTRYASRGLPMRERLMWTTRRILLPGVPLLRDRLR